MYNFVDTWAVIFKNDGRPLVGKIEFCDPVTTELKTIYNVDGNELQNPIYTNAIPSSQIMLDNGDYTVRYYEYIGPGQMEGDYAEEHWRLYKTELVKQNIIAGDNDTTGVYATITTIEQLKEMDTPTDGSVVGVVGYYTAEDCPLRYYVWHETGNYTDDGGVVIKSNHTSQGAWVLKIPGSYIDVRWYGDIPSNLVAGTGSNLGQRTKAATAANKYSKDLYFPSYGKGSTNGYYMFDGSNTVSVNKDIIVDDRVRFTVKHGTVGTQITCHELKACEKYLFVSELNQAIGQYNITADTINTGWFASDKATATGARVKYVIDRLSSPLSFNDSYVELASDIVKTVSFDNCHIDGYKRLSGYVTMQNMVVKTDWFVDDYDWSKLSLYNCQIELENCKDANTYILLKTKQGDPNYGDLGEQSINATVLCGGTIENCFGTINVSGNGNLEFHNVSLTVNNLSTDNTINAVDSWLTINSAVTLGNIQLRRGSLDGSGSFTLIGQSMIEDASIRIPINTTGIKLAVRNCDIYAKITTRNIDLINNQIYAEIDQSDLGGIVYVNLSGNMFHNGAQHYVHADTADSVVKGIWIGNGSSYDTAHWIKLDRTNLKGQDNDHEYTYAKNAEPYLMKWSGRNRPLRFKKYGGYWTTPKRGIGIYSTTTIPFIFLNYRDRLVYAVPRQLYWKAFTVGRGFLARTGHIESNNIHVGIMEGDYVDHKNGNCCVFWTWGSKRYSHSAILDGQSFGYAPMVSRDGPGLAEFNVSFESEDAVHGEYSYGTEIGNLPSSDWQSNSDVTAFATYPGTSNGNAFLFIMMDPDFSTGTNPGEVG